MLGSFKEEKGKREMFAYNSPIQELYCDCSVVPMQKPLGKMEIEMTEAAVQQTKIDETKIQGFCQHLEVDVPRFKDFANIQKQICHKGSRN